MTRRRAALAYLDSLQHLQLHKTSWETVADPNIPAVVDQLLCRDRDFDFSAASESSVTAGVLLLVCEVVSFARGAGVELTVRSNETSSASTGSGRKTKRADHDVLHKGFTLMRLEDKKLHSHSADDARKQLLSDLRSFSAALFGDILGFDGCHNGACGGAGPLSTEREGRDDWQT